MSEIRIGDQLIHPTHGRVTVEDIDSHCDVELIVMSTGDVLTRPYCDVELIVMSTRDVLTRPYSDVLTYEPCDENDWGVAVVIVAALCCVGLGFTLIQAILRLL